MIMKRKILEISLWELTISRPHKFSHNSDRQDSIKWPGSCGSTRQITHCGITNTTLYSRPFSRTPWLPYLQAWERHLLHLLSCSTITGTGNALIFVTTTDLWICFTIHVLVSKIWQTSFFFVKGKLFHTSYI